MPFHDIDELRSAAAGRWAEILISAGIPAKALDGRNHPCPKCGGRDRFAVFRDFDQRGAVHCRRCFTRGAAITPSDGIATIRWWLDLNFPESLAYLADLLGVASNRTNRPSVLSRRSSTVSFSPEPDLARDLVEAHTQFARDAYRRMAPATRTRLAKHLMVSSSSLTALRIGTTSDDRASTWPMRNEKQDVIGVRIVGLPWTDDCHAKWSRRGSQSGLFIARGTEQATRANSADQIAATDRALFITEGASDTAAAISLGLWVIGRASCNSASFFVDRYIRLHKPSSLTIIADHDDAGRSGAIRLAKSLCQNLPKPLHTVQIITPPNLNHDLRDWIGQGANQADISNAVPYASYARTKQTTFDFG